MASYERGERQISLERFFALADVYEMAPERIVAAIAHELATQQESAGARGRPRVGLGSGSVQVLDPFAVGAQERR